MKIRQSLRLYVIVVVLFTAVVTIFALSALGVNYFITGLDVGMKRTLVLEAMHADVAEGQPFRHTFEGQYKPITSTVVISNTWDEQPQVIRSSFDPKNLEFRRLLKMTKGSSLLYLTPPKENHFVTKVKVGQDVRYASISIVTNKEIRIGRFTHFHVILLTGVAAITLFTLVLVFVMRTVSAPVGRLKDWASGIDEAELKKPIPDFSYSELNTLARIIRTSLHSVHESAEREKRFLGFASHELRTPIAVSRTNAELLRKLIEKNSDTDKQLVVLDRIERAGLTMTDLTETLLWLNRENEKDLPVHEVAFGVLVREVSQELAYVLQGKAVTVDVMTDDVVLQLPEMPCRMVIANLIRNAFQHTQEGTVEIRQSGCRLEIVNQDLSDRSEETELGFGLGLELAERLIDKYDWQYTSRDMDTGRAVVISFSAQQGR